MHATFLVRGSLGDALPVLAVAIEWKSKSPQLDIVFVTARDLLEQLKESLDAHQITPAEWDTAIGHSASSSFSSAGERDGVTASARHLQTLCAGCNVLAFNLFALEGYDTSDACCSLFVRSQRTVLRPF